MILNSELVLKIPFESMDFVKRELPNKIRNQLSRYMPFITLKTPNVEETGDNTLSVKITYEVPSLGQSDVLNIDSKVNFIYRRTKVRYITIYFEDSGCPKERSHKYTFQEIFVSIKNGFNSGIMLKDTTPTPLRTLVMRGLVL